MELPVTSAAALEHLVAESPGNLGMGCASFAFAPIGGWTTSKLAALTGALAAGDTNVWEGVAMLGVGYLTAAAAVLTAGTAYLAATHLTEALHAGAGGEIYYATQFTRNPTGYERRHGVLATPVDDLQQIVQNNAAKYGQASFVNGVTLLEPAGTNNSIRLYQQGEPEEAYLSSNHTTIPRSCRSVWIVGRRRDDNRIELFGCGPAVTTETYNGRKRKLPAEPRTDLAWQPV